MTGVLLILVAAGVLTYGLHELAEAGAGATLALPSLAAAELERKGTFSTAALAQAGYSLAIHGSHDTRLDSHLAIALEENGAEWEGFVVDFADPEAAEELVAVALNERPSVLSGG